MAKENNQVPFKQFRGNYSNATTEKNIEALTGQ